MTNEIIIRSNLAALSLGSPSFFFYFFVILRSAPLVRNVLNNSHPVFFHTEHVM
jgi:hypothetical protein